MSTEKLEKERQDVEDFVQLLPFHDHPGFRFKPFLEGYRNYAFGATAGPSTGPAYLCHELAHAAEFGSDQFEDRVRPWGWAFKEHINDEFYMTPKATQRECRTMGIQMRIMEHTGIMWDASEFLRISLCSMDFMPDWDLSWGNTDRQHAMKDLILSTRNQCDIRAVMDDLTVWMDKTAQAIATQEESNQDNKKIRIRA